MHRPVLRGRAFFKFRPIAYTEVRQSTTMQLSTDVQFRHHGCRHGNEQSLKLRCMVLNCRWIAAANACLQIYRFTSTLAYCDLYRTCRPPTLTSGLPIEKCGVPASMWLRQGKTKNENKSLTGLLRPTATLQIKIDSSLGDANAALVHCYMHGCTAMDFGII